MVSRFSTKSKYKSLSYCAQESAHISRLLVEVPFANVVQVPLHNSTTSVLDNLTQASTHTKQDIHLHCQNMGAIKLAKNPVFHARSKHIEINHHFFRERVLASEISLAYVSTNEQLADLLTKPLGKVSLHNIVIILEWYRQGLSK